MSLPSRLQLCIVRNDVLQVQWHIVCRLGLGRDLVFRGGRSELSVKGVDLLQLVLKFDSLTIFAIFSLNAIEHRTILRLFGNGFLTFAHI